MKTTPARKSGSAGKARDGTAKGRGRKASPALSYAAPAAASNPAARRKFLVFVSLVGLLSLTSVVLKAIAPSPLDPTATTSLFAIDAPQSMDEIFRTSAPVEGGKWKYLFVHHSRTPAGNASLLATDELGCPDHFIIGNGEGAIDGEIQLSRRWAQQLPAGAVSGVDRMDPACISICLVGDFDQTSPSPNQNLRLAQLVSTLQRRLNLKAEQVLMLDGQPSPAGVGRNFPAAQFRSQLLP